MTAIRKALAMLAGVTVACLVMVLMPGEARAVTPGDGSRLSVNGGTNNMVNNGTIVGTGELTVGGGSASFDAATDTLTLTNYVGGPIKAERIDLNIVLSGASVITASDFSGGISLGSSGNLSISGGGSLIVNQSSTDGFGLSWGIYVNGSFEMAEDCTITINVDGDTDQNIGLFANGADINGGTLIIKVANSSARGTGIDGYNGGVVIDGGKVNIDVACDDVIDSTGINTYASITIVPDSGAELTIDANGGSALVFGGSLNASGALILEGTDAAYPDEAEASDLNGAGTRAYVYIKAADPVGDDPDHQRAARDKKKEVAVPVVAVLYDAAKTGDAFTFKIILMNGRNNMAGTTVKVSLNEKYTTTVTIGQDGVCLGTIDAPGFAGNIANFSTQPNAPGAGSVTTVYTIYSTGEVVRR